MKNKYDITVAAKSVFIPEQSDEAASRFVFAYTITITNPDGQTASASMVAVMATSSLRLHGTKPQCLLQAARAH